LFGGEFHTGSKIGGSCLFGGEFYTGWKVEVHTCLEKNFIQVQR
jgi:hypothetical protein